MGDALRGVRVLVFRGVRGGSVDWEVLESVFVKIILCTVGKMEEMILTVRGDRMFVDGLFV